MNRFPLGLGIDRAVFFTLMGRGWNVGAGLITLFFVIHFLSPALQGYYYTFYSLIALQIFVELGLNFAVVQFASHEMAHLSWLSDGAVSGHPEAKRRLQSLMHFAFSWFGVAALLMMTLLLPAGLYFFNSGQSDRIAVSIAIPWILLVIFTAANLFVTAAVAILEGCGKVADVAVLRLWQSILSVGVGWVVLSLGGHLYALAANSFMMVWVGFVLLWSKYQLFFRDIHTHSKQLPGMSWRHEIWPFQWRIALSWMSGYLVFQLFTPLLFKTDGPVVAGQMGMSLQIIGAMNGFAMSWITTKAPMYGQLIATNQRKKMDELFVAGLVQSFSFLLVGVVSVWLLLFFLHQTASPHAVRVLSLPLFSWLCVVCLANHIVFAEAAYLRAHKQEPFMLLSIAAGLVTAILALLFVPPFSAAGAVYAYTIPALLIGLLCGTVIFISKRKQWNRTPSVVV